MKAAGIIVHEIAEDGLPDMETLVGKVAFIFDGCIVTGWPNGQHQDGEAIWEADGDIGGGVYFGVTHWVELSASVVELTN